jgi:hypothetical protein
MREKRKLNRLKLLYHLRVFDRTNYRLLGHLADIHTDGMMVIGERLEEINKIYNIRIILPEVVQGQEEIYFSAKVVWSRQYVNPLFYQTGYKIERISEEFVQLMESWIKKFGFHGLFQSNAVRNFRGIEGYNCAQAILKVFQERFDINPNLISQYAAHGGGNAEDGICGALYAVLQLAANYKLSEIVRERFEKEVGSVYCDEILCLGRLSCAGCIFTASKILKQILDES